jgi:uncharacterized SAM-binding protein YcdF (DUF218 family)
MTASEPAPRVRAVRRAMWFGAAVLLVGLSTLQIERVAGLVKQFVPGSVSFFLLALGIGTLTMVVHRSAWRPVLRSLLALTLVYLALACPWTAHRLAAGLYSASADGRLEDFRFETPDRAAVAVFAGDHDSARRDEALRLVHQLRPRWMIVSGGADFRDGLAGADVSADRLLWDDHPINTRAQALHLRAIVDRHGIHEVLLVASPLHMRRALGACLREGIPVKPSPSRPPHAGLPGNGPGSFVPSLEALRFSWEALYEYLGLVYYRGRGWLAQQVVTPGSNRVPVAVAGVKQIIDGQSL